MPTTPGLTNAPFTKTLIIYIVASALLASLSDTKHYFNLLVVPHIFPHNPTTESSYRLSTSDGNRVLHAGTGGQYWRLLTWVLVYANSTEVLFACMTVYQLRVVERIWGTRKTVRFLLQSAPYTVLLPPVLLTFLLRPLGALVLGEEAAANCLPGGVTSFIWALVAQWYEAVPSSFVYKVGLGSVSAGGEGEGIGRGTEGEGAGGGITLTSKSTSYFLPLQLALSQFPANILPALVGWCVGLAWRAGVLPVIPVDGRWVPQWFGGRKGSGRSRSEQGLEGMRRALHESGQRDD